ncbi:hypothetical protein [Actinacidiphila epipremni]|nr:hypothetical protein [Actinacidiphila epipremni]
MSAAGSGGRRRPARTTAGATTRLSARIGARTTTRIPVRIH